DATRARITLFFGVHDELPVFVAADPSMHNPTWFSSSVEFKADDLRRALTQGWYGWERDRVQRGRRKAGKEGDLRTEALLAFKPENFLTYVAFERIATAMDAGERLLLSDRVGERLADSQAVMGLLAWRRDTGADSLLRELSLTLEELAEVLRGRFRLLAAL